MSVIHGDCLDVMAAMEPESVDAIVTDPPYGLEFMGKEWDRLGGVGKTSHSGPAAVAAGERGQYGKVSFSGSSNVKCQTCGKWQWDHVGRKCECERPDFPSVKAHQGRLMQQWHQQWAEAAYRVAKPSAYLLAFGGTRTVHRMTVALEDAGWIIRDMLVWAYASGFPKSKASLKPAWEPIVMARKPGPLRMLAIDECRIPAPENVGVTWTRGGKQEGASLRTNVSGENEYVDANPAGRWPANVILTDPIFDGGIEGVVGGGEAGGGFGVRGGGTGGDWNPTDRDTHLGQTIRGGGETVGYGDSGTYSRFFIIPKADRADREPVLGGHGLSGERGYGAGKGVKTRECKRCGDRTQSDTRPYQPACGHGDWEWQDALPLARANVHPTVKPTDLMRHLVRLVTPTGGTVLDPFLGSGTTALAAEMEGFAWIGIEREAEYVAIAEARLNGTQRGLGLDVGAPTPKMPNTHPDLSKHQPKRRAPSESYSGGWPGLEPQEEPA